MPLAKGASKAFPSPKKHFKLASRWDEGFTVMESRGNEERTKSQREFFDRPLSKPAQVKSSKKISMPLKPMEIYHKITPVRSIQQSINLIKALRIEEEEERVKTLPKPSSVFSATLSDSYGAIPNLRTSNSLRRLKDLSTKQRTFMSKFKSTHDGRSTKRLYTSGKEFSKFASPDS